MPKLPTGDQLIAKISAARKDMDEAEHDIDQILDELRVAPRAEKTTITPVLEAAFAKLRSARTLLAELEVLVKGED